MRTSRIFHAVDSHTEGMPTRVITGGIGTIPGATMAERRLWFMENSDWIRTLLMNEPRGHASMSGAILQPPTRPDADFGVLFIEVSGLLPMCGHGTIGVATVLVETGMVEVVEPVTTIRLDTPAGLVVAEVAVKDGQAESVTIRNVPSFVDRLDATVEVPGLRHGGLRPGVRRQLLRHRGPGQPGPAVRARGARTTCSRPAWRSWTRSTPRTSPSTRSAPTSAAATTSTSRPRAPRREHSRHAMAIHPGWFDRSPCGTGTSARMAQLHARGELALGTDFVNESYIGSRFIGRLVEETEVAGRPAVVPTVTGRAWLTGTAQYFLDPTDPFPAGFLL